jgi:hypothetical protein
MAKFIDPDSFLSRQPSSSCVFFKASLFLCQVAPASVCIRRVCGVKPRNAVFANNTTE